MSTIDFRVPKSLIRLLFEKPGRRKKMSRKAFTRGSYGHKRSKLPRPVRAL